MTERAPALKLRAATLNDTEAIGRALADILQPGDLVALEGDLGSGKTALARATIRALLRDPALEVPSPSFSLVQLYQGPEAPVVHADLYRLSDASEVAELGLENDPRAVVLVEWPERDPGIGSKATLRISLRLASLEGERIVAVEADVTRLARLRHILAQLLVDGT